jgi:glycosyltransferase involved in cell wall biosynthesis
MKHPLNVFFSTEDNFPPFRVDVADLFGNRLSHLGLNILWGMKINTKSNAKRPMFMGQKVYLPFFFSGNLILTKVANKMAYWFNCIWQMLSCLNRDVDLIQVRDQYIASVVGLMVAKVKGIPFVYWCSYPFPEHYLLLSESTYGLRRIYCFIHGKIGFLLLYKLVMPNCAHVFVQSDFMQAHLAKKGVPLSLMTTVPMGVPDKIFSILSAHTKNVKSAQFVYIGTLANIRNLHCIIEAFARVYQEYPNAELIMVGEGDHPNERTSLEQLSRKLGLDQAITFTGFVPMEKAWEIAAQSCCCLSPFFPSVTLNMASPTKMVEYMALARPIICNDQPEQKKIIEESGVGLCVNWSPKAFADAMVWILANPQKAEVMAQKGPAWVKQHRTYSIISQKVWLQYQTLFENKP